eukprot:SAG31_NODE_40271_length_281_cov_5.620879_1_plen_67_part_01
MSEGILAKWAMSGLTGLFSGGKPVGLTRDWLKWARSRSAVCVLHEQTVKRVRETVAPRGMRTDPALL